MCGIVAVRSRRGPVDAGRLERATRALRHRGPDGSRTWTCPTGQVGLGHTHLAIVDPDGVQPIANETGRMRIVANGELYDFERARCRLEAAGHRFRTRSDSEVALHLYEELGPACVERLHGEFAFVVWDEERGTLFAARDRFGTRTLFYAEHGGALWLASEAKALFAAGVPAAWDELSVYRALHACPDEAGSMFRGIRQIPPGHRLLASGGSVRLEAWWDVPLGRRDPAEPAVESGDARVERVRELLGDAVERRTRAAVPVGCLLSGGLDSSAVLGGATARRGRPPTAFTVSFDDRAYDELHHAHVAATHVGARLVCVPVTDRDVADHFAHAVWHAETLQYNGHGAARYLLSRGVAGAGYRAVMGGEGGDELFYGYEFLRVGAGGRGGLRGWTRALLRLAFRRSGHPGLRATSPWLARLASLLGVSPALLRRLEAGLGRSRSVQAPDFLERFRDYDVYAEFYDACNARARISQWSPARQILYLWLHSIFAAYHMAADRLDMAHGVEVRLPFLDDALFEAVQALPAAPGDEGAPEKWLLRAAAGPWLPAPIRERPKKPFWAPPAAADPGSPVHALVQDTLRSQAMASVPFFDARGVVALLDGLGAVPAEERAGVDSLLYALASAAVLAERFGL